MADKKFPKSELPIRKSSKLLPNVFQTSANEKFMEAVVDPLVQPGVLEKTVGYVGRRYGKTYRGKDIYLDSDGTLRSRYQLEPGVITRDRDQVSEFFDYIDLKNQLKFFGNQEEKDSLTTNQEHYSWNPPIDWDKFINYREYYWVPAGPPEVVVFGNRPTVTSTYTVVLGLGSSFIFRPDGFTNNPTITLYRGQTYKFKVNAPGQGFVIRSNYDSASLKFRDNKFYNFGNIVSYDDKLWRALGDVPPNNPPADGSIYWTYIDLASSQSALDYNKGVTNNGTENGTVTFKVPYDAPDFLYYQSKVDADRFGKFIIGNIEEDTRIEIEKEILGKQQYTSSNGVVFSNGLIVEFRGKVAPEKYSTGLWLVEGVGDAIQLIRFSDLEVPAVNNSSPTVVFDNSGFDTEPFDDASNYPGTKDYFTINRTSIDLNPWSRYNRWFHKSVLEYAYTFRGQTFLLPESDRAKRPIIEFAPNLQLFNHGTKAKASVDFVETSTDDVFSIIEGSSGYVVDGEPLFDGARILVVSDTDSLYNNRIYRVEFIKHNNRRQIALRETEDSDSQVGECLLIKRGKTNSGLMYYFNGSTWIKSQQKTSVNQPPLFDAFDENGISYSDPVIYPINNFKGTHILSYKIGNGPIDKELGIRIQYLNIDNVGDIVFDWNWGTESFLYTKNQLLTSKLLDSGYYRINQDLSIFQFENGWIKTDNSYIQPIIDSVTIFQDTDRFVLSSIDWDLDPSALINFYLNGKKIDDEYQRQGDTFIFDRLFQNRDVISVKIISNLEPRNGYYEIPVGLEKNPLNQELESFTLGQAVDHIFTAVEFDTDFQGTVPGDSNLRDISSYKKHAKRFMKHGSCASLAISFLCDKNNNLIKALQFAKKSYVNFKNNFLIRSTELPFNDNPADFLDEILSDLTKVKNQESTFFDSDMIGTGAYTSIDYTVEDEGIRTFALSEKFTLAEPSRRAVYVYVNGKQLLNGKQYNFNSNFGFITITAEIEVNDKIQIREYVSTASCFIPATPTKLGLYKKYTPQKFIDDTYREPREVIQGHDGSITFSYGDFRDDLLLELEYRIYNNIKQEYNESILDIDSILGGYYGNSEFGKSQLDRVVNQEFLRWIQNSDVNYTLNTYFAETETFTYTYSNMTDPTGTVNLPGWWRGVYQWFYDTDRPHRCPWEMLGFSQQPDWWEAEYGPAPYTNGNLILWEDLANGIIRQGSRAGTYNRYKRPSLLNHIPVDGDGKLLSPLDSGLAQNFVLINNKGNFKFGDINPAEYAWRSSSDWPFTLMIALALLKPFDFIPRNFDRSKIKVNRLGQQINIDSNTFVSLDKFTVPSIDNIPTVGLINYLTDFAKSKRIPIESVESKIKDIDVVLSTRISGFVDKDQQKYFLDSKNPRSSSSGVFVPPENYEIVFNVSSPIDSVSYSGVVLEKTQGGWLVSGYDTLQPYFNYYLAVSTQKDPVITVGGISETFSVWTPDTTYNNGQVVKYQNDFYRAIKTNRSSAAFDISVWRKLPDLPITGGVTAFRRKNFNAFSIRQVAYGTKFTTIQEVVDFLLGYEQYLLSKGFKFDRYDRENQVSQNWLTSCKEFMFWTQQNWAEGSLITLSPSSQAIDLNIPVGVADNLLDSFYDYQIFKSDGSILDSRFINVNRSFQNLIVETTNTTDGIYFIRVNYVLKEHVTVFSDRTVFNDVIYDKITGYRQERIKVQGFRTTDWDGDYTSPGFIFDNVDIDVWQPFTDYKLGDIVEYQSRYWTSQVNQLASDTFDENNWSLLDLIPEKQLIPNFDYKINLFDDYYNVAAEGVGQSQRTLARHAIGYQERQYLQDLAEDPITQFQLYQGFIREKGTANSITKVFDKLSRAGSDSIQLDEEWAFLLGKFGGTDQTREIEFTLQKDKFLIDPQPIIVSEDYLTYPDDQYYRITAEDFTVSPIPYTTNVNPLDQTNTVKAFKTAGYVRTDQVDFTVKTRDDILNLNILDFVENDYVWVTFDTFTNKSWSVLEFKENQNLQIEGLEKSGDFVAVILNQPHGLEIGEIVGIKGVKNLTGFYKVEEPQPDLIDSSLTVITVKVPQGSEDPELEDNPKMCLFFNSRFDSYQSLDPSKVALMPEDSKVWIDDNGHEQWEVIQKKRQYTSKIVDTYAGLENLNVEIGAGNRVIYDKVYRQVIVSMPTSSRVISYSDTQTDSLAVKGVINPLKTFDIELGSSFGESMALSPDSEWLVVGAPRASDIPNRYRGVYDPQPGEQFQIGDIVLFGDRLWVAIKDSEGDGSTIDVDNEYWAPAKLNEAELSGIVENVQPGFENQGAIFIYQRIQQSMPDSDRYWNLRHVLISPRPAADENFGSNLQIGQDGNRYFIVASATGTDNRGRVYLYEYDQEWRHSEPTFLEETVEEGALYGFGLAINKTADILAVGSPETDITSDSKGKVFVYQKNSEETYERISIVTTDDLEENQLNLRDQFGYSLAMDDSGSTLIISSPEFDFNNFDQGAVFVFKTNDTVSIDYTFRQKLISFETYSGEFFGKSISISSDGTKIAVGAAESCDENYLYDGTVYVFELKDQIYFLADKLQPELDSRESFGFSVDVEDSVIAVGSPCYQDNRGTARIFRKIPGTNSWQVIANQQPLVDIDKIKSVALYDTINNIKLGDVDYVDPAKLKILNIAEQEIKFKTPYDPAIYSIGTNNEEQTVDSDLAWADQHVGELWWDLSTVKWIYYEQGDIAYRTGNWNQLAVGASVDVYEWVRTPLLPSEWSILADTNEGVAEGISGQPKDPLDTVYSFKELFNEFNGQPTETLYYYWVKNSVVIPQNVVGRRLPADQVASLIADPSASGERFISFVDSDKFLSFNLAPIVNKDGTVLNIDYYTSTRNTNLVHREYQLLTEGVEDSLPSLSLETKWIDSLVGYDSSRRPVPDPNLSPKQRYGISFRPRQTMFVDRKTALKIVIDRVNSVLKKDVFSDFVSMINLESFDDIPNEILNLYDQTVDLDIDLTTIITSRIKPAKLKANILDGELDTIEILDPGFGYKVPPPIDLDGDGKAASAVAEIDIKGRIKSVSIINRGKRYTAINAKVRQFSVLVRNDSTINNQWSIYSWDESRKVFFRTRSQAFDTRKYWTMVDWWKEGFNSGSRIVQEITSVAEEFKLSAKSGDLIRIKNYGSRGWAVFQRTEQEQGLFLEKYRLVGREKGTIELSNLLYDNRLAGIGYDAFRSFDIGEYDIENFIELRNILKAIKEDLFVGDYTVEWNQLFFASIRYVFSEQQYVDWAFKTSFLNAIHTVGNLEQKLSYRSDSLASFQQYINEVKPYRTTVREYTSKYTNLDRSNTEITDFDLPAAYSEVDGKVVPITENNDLINSRPWKWWLDNRGFSVVDILIADGGDGYIQPPTVLIEGNGSGASARAYIRNGKVSKIQILDPGKGYTEVPSISLVGGNAENPQRAKAIAVLGDTKVRNFRLGIKFDRISKSGQFQKYTQKEVFRASGVDAVFNLTYPPTLDKSKIEIFIDGRLMFEDEYSISLYTVTIDSTAYTLGKIIFNTEPAAGAVVEITYDKSDSILDSVDRINKYYDPKSGMRGKDLPQLMTGIDFGGVQIQGSSFGLTGGWDALPWYTDAWDAVDPSGDFYYVFVAQDYDPDRFYKTGSTIRFDNKIYTFSEFTVIGQSPEDINNWKLISEKPENFPEAQLYSNSTEYFIDDVVRFQSKIYKLVDIPVQADPPGVGNLSESRWELTTLESVELPFVPREGQYINIYRSLKNTDIDYKDDEPYQLNDVVRFRTRYYKSTFEGITLGSNPTEDFNKWQEIYETYRVDDPYWIADDSSDSSAVTNLDALMPSFLGDGVNNTVNIGEYFTAFPGEILIFRPEESDGANTIINADVIDTNIVGGTLAEMSGALITAQGITAEEIVVNGGVYISPDFVPAPEENVPGQVLDSVSIKVFHKDPDNGDTVYGYEVQKDMLNLHSFKRYSLGTYFLAKDLNYYDTELVVNDATGMVVPNTVKNVPGIITIGGERIEFLHRDGNTLRRLRRGAWGTSIGVIYPAGTPIVDISYDETVPYREETVKNNFVYEIASTIADDSRLRLELVKPNSYRTLDPKFVGALPATVDGVEKFVGDERNIVVKIKSASNGEITTLTRDQYSVSEKVAVVWTGAEEFLDLEGHYVEAEIDDPAELEGDLYINNVVVDGVPGFTAIVTDYEQIEGSVYRFFLVDSEPWTITENSHLLSEVDGKYSINIDESVEIKSEDQVFVYPLLVGSLSFTPRVVTSTVGMENSWFRETIPETFGQTDEIEVFVGGRRKYKISRKIYDEVLGAQSPAADKVIEADFSVDGSRSYIRLTEPVENAGTRVTVIKRTGTVWYERGAETASKGVTLLKNNTPPARFIKQKPTDQPE
jgi:hypothetical protein